MKISNFLKIILFFKLLLLAFFLTNCANIQSPSGGPKDSIPPTVINAFPLDMATNFKDEKIEIQFSEWPDRNKVVQNISISPPINLGYKWSGTKVKVEFLDTLKTNTTYSFLLGTEYSDLKGNKPDSAFAITFSTGSVIDSGKIEGMLYGEKVPGTFIYGYRVDDKRIDTLNPEMTIAEFKTQVGNMGSFSLRALPDGIYRIMAVKTDFKDNLFHPVSDYFGTTSSDIEVKNGSSKLSKIYYSKYPNFQPNQIVSVESYANNTISFIFTKPLVQIDKFVPGSEFLQIIDSASLKSYGIKNYFLDSAISAKLYVTLSDSITSQSQLTLNILQSNVFKDTSDVLLNKLSYKFNPKLSDKKFTFQPNSNPLKDSLKGIMHDNKFVFNFNCPIKFDSLGKYFQFQRLTDNSDIPFEVIQASSNSLQLIPKSELLSESWYRVNFNQGAVESIFGDKLKDTLLKYDFMTGDWRVYPSVSGKLLDKSGCKGLVLRLISDEGKQSYETKNFPKGDWIFDKVKPGKYHLETYCDANQNGKYDSGISYPFQFAEKFKIFSNVIEVKERWNVENIMLLFDE